MNQAFFLNWYLIDYEEQYYVHMYVLADAVACTYLWLAYPING